MADRSELERVVPPEVEVIESRRTIVTALPLRKRARERLALLLGARVVDVRDPCDDPHMVLTPSCSPQLIGALRRKYPGARVVIVELDDWDLDIEIRGPVKRLLNAGADAYLLADSMEELAAKIGRTELVAESSAPAAGPIAELSAASTIDELIAAFFRESVEYSTRVHPASSRSEPAD